MADDKRVDQLPSRDGSVQSTDLMFVEDALTHLGYQVPVSDISSSAGGVQSVIPGSGIAVDNTDPLHPIVTNTGGGGGGSAVWGGIAGTIGSQTDLTAALNAKAPLASPVLTGAPTTPTPLTALGIANKSYVDSVAQGLTVKTSVEALSAANTVLSGLQTIDGVSLSANDRVLLISQTTASQNGLWVVQSGAWTRPVDFLSGSTQKGSFTFVEGGTVYKATGWVLVGTSYILIDTSPETWTQFSSAASISAGSGLTLTGGVMSADLTIIAPLASPTLTGAPRAPTATLGTNTTQIATTAFVQAATPDATATIKGKIQLGGGDLGGMASAVLIKRTASVIVAAYGYAGPADFVCATATGNETEINAGIAAANALPTGGYVHLIGGAFVVSGDGIVPMSKVTLTCEAGVTIKHDNSASSYTDIGSKPIIRNSTADITDFGVEYVAFIGDDTTNSTSCAIYLDGDGDPHAPVGAPVITNFTMRNVNFRNCQSLPVRLFGLRGKLQASGCEFTHNADAGFGFCEEVIFTGNHSMNSKDNGFSLSRGNKKVICANNTVENPTFWGIWMSGYAGDIGPMEFTCTGNVVINSPNSCIALEGGPANGVVSGNYLDQNHNRPQNSYIDGIEVYGAAGSSTASNIIVTGNTILNPARAGVSVAQAANISITGNLIVNPGTQYFADGVTPILSTDTTTNAGILSTHLSNSRIFVDGNTIIDNRPTPYCNWDVWKVQSGSSGIKNGTNYSVGMRNTRNTLTLFDLPTEAGNPVNLNVDGPDANINLRLNIQGTGQFQVRGQTGFAVNIESVDTSSSAQTKLRFSAGSDTTPIGQLTATRTDSSSSSLIALNPISSGVLQNVSSTSAPFYLQGSPTGTGAYIGLNGGLRFNRRNVADAAVSPSPYDYLIGYSSLTSGHTVTLPTAVQVAGQTYIINDETGTAATNNITVVPFSLGTITFADTDVDPTIDSIHLATNIVTGTPVSITTAGTMPAGLTASTTYYVAKRPNAVKNILNNPGTAANDSSAGLLAWSSPSNAIGSDNAYATWTSDGGIDPSNPRGDTVTFSGSITSGTKALTSSTAVFNVLTDAGKYVRITGAGAGGADLITSIASVVSTTQATLAVNAGTTVSGVASAFGTTDSLTSQYLKVTNFGFSLLSTATIEGIVVKVEHKSTSTSDTTKLVYDTTAQLVKGGTIQGNNYAINAQFGSSDTVQTYGTTTDKWGLAWTAADINNSNFGFVYQVNSILGTANIDNVSITVYYTLPNDVRLSTTLSNALAGTVIDITDAGSGSFSLTAPAQTIDGASSYVINRNNGAIALYSDGSNWFTQGGIHVPAGSLKSATTTIDLAAATAPTIGQILTATDSTHARWQAPAFTNPMTTLGDMLYESGTPTASRLAGNTTATKKFLTQTGTGSVSAAPAWGTLAAGDVPTLNQDTTGKSGATDALNSATTIVNVAAATAPTPGQVITAVDSTHATWQAAAGGPPTGSAGGDLTGTYPNPTLAVSRLEVANNLSDLASAATARTNLGVATQIGYDMNIGSQNFAPLNATTYFLGGTPGQGPNTTASNARVVIPRAGTITDVYIVVFNSATTPTSETSTISLRLNNTSDTSISSSVNLNSATTAPQVYSITGQSISVSAGDYIEIKWVTPTWSTKPTSVRIWGSIYVQQL